MKIKMFNNKDIAKSFVMEYSTLKEFSKVKWNMMDIWENPSIHKSECQLTTRYSFNLCLLQRLQKLRNLEIKNLCYPSPRFHNGAVTLIKGLHKQRKFKFTHFKREQNSNLETYKVNELLLHLYTACRILWGLKNHQCQFRGNYTLTLAACLYDRIASPVVTYFQALSWIRKSIFIPNQEIKCEIVSPL